MILGFCLFHQFPILLLQDIVMPQAKQKAYMRGAAVWGGGVVGV